MSLEKEKLILNNLLNNEEYTRSVINFLKPEYFTTEYTRSVFTIVKDYFDRHNSNPNKTILSIDIDNSGLKGDSLLTAKKLITEITRVLDKKSESWLLKTTEDFCKQRALQNSVNEAVSVFQGETSDYTLSQIPSLLTSALGVSFNKNVGHDFMEDYVKRFSLYSESVQKVPFSLSYFNKITKGGFANKTLNIILAPTGVGKSLFMCDFAASNMRNGYNVLYITLEMSEEKIGQRIDANLLDISINDFDVLPQATYYNLIENLKKNVMGNLIIKEYPTGSASVSDFKNLLDELRIKKNFVPHIIYIDYMNICSSARMKNGTSSSYAYIKSISEELRGLGVEYNVPIVTATQTNRSGINASDIDLTNTSDSIGGPMTADLLFAVISNDELAERKQLIVKQLKSRYGDMYENNKFLIGVDKSKMKLYDVGQEYQDDLTKVIDENEIKKTIDREFFNLVETD